MHIVIVGIIIAVAIGLRVHYQYGTIPEGEEKEYEDSTGHLYLQQYDPYVHYQNVKKQTGEPFSMMLASWHALLTIFLPGITLMGSMGLYPLLFTALLIITAYASVIIISQSTAAGAISAFILAINPLIFRTTFIGFADTNALNYFFTLATILFLFTAYKGKIWGVAGLITCLIIFPKFWSGGNFILIFILASSCAYLFFEKVVRDKIKGKFAWKNAYFLLLATLALLIILIPFMQKYNHYFIPEEKENTGYDIIAELEQPPPTNLLKEATPVWALAILSFPGILYLIWREPSKEKYFLLVYTAGCLIAGFLGVRFVFFAVLGFALLIPYIMSRFLDEKYMVVAGIIIIGGIATASIQTSAYAWVGKGGVSVVDDSTYEGLQDMNCSGAVGLWDKEEIIESLSNCDFKYHPYHFDYTVDFVRGLSLPEEEGRNYIGGFCDGSCHLILLKQDLRTIRWWDGQGRLRRWGINLTKDSWISNIEKKMNGKSIYISEVIS